MIEKLQSTEDVVYETCLILIRHFRTLLRLNKDELGFHTRLFSHILHPETTFVYAGQSEDISPETGVHLEHVVPCAALITHCKLLIKANKLSDEEIAQLLQKHWKVAHISRREQHILDSKNEKNLKSKMPPDWTFEDGDTFERLKLAGIKLRPL
jgi:predicted small metal-binding protein